MSATATAGHLAGRGHVRVWPQVVVGRGNGGGRVDLSPNSRMRLYGPVMPRIRGINRTRDLGATSV